MWCVAVTHSTAGVINVQRGFGRACRGMLNYVWSSGIMKIAAGL